MNGHVRSGYMERSTRKAVGYGVASGSGVGVYDGMRMRMMRDIPLALYGIHGLEGYLAILILLQSLMHQSLLWAIELAPTPFAPISDEIFSSLWQCTK
jgi:hypothetical protein